MENSVYRRLQEKINEYGTGFPASKSGVELKLLKILFTEQDAELYMKMASEPQTVEMIARRLGEDIDKTTQHLERMLESGTVLCMEKEGRTVYSPAPYMVGLYENLAHKMDETVAELLEQYHKEAYFEHLANKMPPVLRYVPVKQALKATPQVLPHDDVIEILKSKKKIAVIDYVCRKQVQLTGTPTKPIEVCFSFDGYADYYVNKRKQGRFLSLEEAIEIQKQCEEAGLVTMSTIMKDHGIMCHCDKHCVVLRSWGNHRPADYFKSNYYSEVDAEFCTGCEECSERCPTEAITIGEDQVASINLDRCLGCGLCVTACPNDSISLKQKPEDELIKELVDIKLPAIVLT
jgi:Na+-translocating ferredoxin:NAD+ oxidoreductase subunit B